jgi:hypothetical protein
MIFLIIVWFDGILLHNLQYFINSEGGKVGEEGKVGKEEDRKIGGWEEGKMGSFRKKGSFNFFYYITI